MINLSGKKGDWPAALPWTETGKFGKSGTGEKNKARVTSEIERSAINCPIKATTN